MALEGRLREIRLVDLLDVLTVSGCTGRVEVANGQQSGEIGVHQGAVVRARLGADKAIGEALVTAGKISREQLEHALALQESPSHSPLLLGTILVNMGAITLEELDRFVRARTLAAVRAMAFWETGTFRFVPDGAAAVQGEFPNHVDRAMLWAEIAGGADAVSQLLQGLPSLDAFVEPGPALRQNGLQLRLNRDEWTIALMVGRGRRLRDVLDEADTLDERQALAALYSLLGSGNLISRAKSAERLRVVEAGVARLHRAAGAAGIVLATLDGRRLCAHGVVEDMDADSLAALCLGAFMCTEGMLEGSPNGDSRQVVVAGQRWKVLLASIGRCGLLIFLFRADGLLGQLRLLSREFARDYGPVLDVLIGPSNAAS